MTVLKFKGRLFFRQYLASKPSVKWGIKVWFLCDAHSGHLLKLSVHTSEETAVQQTGKGNLGTRAVLSLLEGSENKGHVSYTNNIYSSAELFCELREGDAGACGTVHVNRKGLHKETGKGGLPVIWKKKEKTKLACTWQDTK